MPCPLCSSAPSSTRSTAARRKHGYHHSIKLRTLRSAPLCNASSRTARLLVLASTTITTMTSCSESWTSPIATNAHLDADRQRLRDENELLYIQLRVSYAKSEALTTRVRELTEHSASLRDALHAILRLQRVVDDDRNDDEAEEESLLELYELRRWRQQFAVEPSDQPLLILASLPFHVTAYTLPADGSALAQLADVQLFCERFRASTAVTSQAQCYEALKVCMEDRNGLFHKQPQGYTLHPLSKGQIIAELYAISWYIFYVLCRTQLLVSTAAPPQLLSQD